MKSRFDPRLCRDVAVATCKLCRALMPHTLYDPRASVVCMRRRGCPVQKFTRVLFNIFYTKHQIYKTELSFYCQWNGIKYSLCHQLFRVSAVYQHPILAENTQKIVEIEILVYFDGFRPNHGSNIITAQFWDHTWNPLIKAIILDPQYESGNKISFFDFL